MFVDSAQAAGVWRKHTATSSSFPISGLIRMTWQRPDTLLQLSIEYIAGNINRFKKGDLNDVPGDLLCIILDVSIAPAGWATFRATFGQLESNVVSRNYAYMIFYYLHAST